MKPIHQKIIIFATNLTPVQFARDDDRPGMLGTAAKIGAVGGGAYYAGNVASRALGPMVRRNTTGWLDRLKAVGQKVAAKPGVAVSNLGGVVASDATRAGKYLAGAGKGLLRRIGLSSRQKLIELAAKVQEFDAAQWIVGNPMASAASARPGKKLDAYKDAVGDVMVDSQIGGVTGALAGGAAGALATRHPKVGKAITRSVNEHFLRGRSQAAAKANRILHVPKWTSGKGKAVIGGVAGAGLGLLAGSAIGAVHGHVGARANEIKDRYR